METELIRENGRCIAVVNSEECVVKDAASALDFAMGMKYGTGCTGLAVNKGAVAEEFFVLSNGIAGEIMQKFVNYGIRFAIYGDFSKYTSKPLKDLMYECNMGKDFYFQLDAKLAAGKLAGVC